MFEKFFAKKESVTKELTPVESVISQLIQDMSYSVTYLSGNSPEEGMYYFQPLRPLEFGKETNVENNKIVLTITELDNLASELLKDLESAGFMARVETISSNASIKVEVIDQESVDEVTD